MELELSLDKPISYFSKGEDILIIQRCSEQKEIMKNNVATLTDITPANITMMEAKIQDFIAIHDKPNDSKKMKKVHATEPIHDKLNEIDGPKNILGKIVYGYLPDLISEWNEISRIGDSEGLHHTSLFVQYTGFDTGIHLKNVQCTLTDGITTITKKSSIKGWVRFYSLNPGEWTLTSTYMGYETDVLDKIGTDKDRIVNLEVKLKKKSLDDDGTTPPDPETTTGILDLFVFDKENSEPLGGVRYVIDDQKRINTTDEDGEGYEDLLLPGNHTGILYMDGYVDQSFTFSILAGETTTINLYMDKVLL